MVKTIRPLKTSVIIRRGLKAATTASVRHVKPPTYADVLLKDIIPHAYVAQVFLER